jgi:hypothetical protein
VKTKFTQLANDTKLHYQPRSSKQTKGATRTYRLSEGASDLQVVSDTNSVSSMASSTCCAALMLILAQGDFKLSRDVSLGSQITSVYAFGLKVKQSYVTSVENWAYVTELQFWHLASIVDMFPFNQSLFEPCSCYVPALLSERI